MRADSLPRRFSLKTLILAALTCSISFGIISWEPWDVVVQIASCVPVFWAGWAAVFVGTMISEERGIVIQAIGIAIRGCGIVLLAGSCFFVTAVTLFATTHSIMSL